MLLGQVFERFVKESPISVMVRGLLEKPLCPQIIDNLAGALCKNSIHSRAIIFHSCKFEVTFFETVYKMEEIEIQRKQAGRFILATKFWVDYTYPMTRYGRLTIFD